MYGWYRYSSRFALPVFGEDGEITRYNVFNVIMIIRHARDGKKYLYDIINIKKETSTLFQSEDITQVKTHFLYIILTCLLMKVNYKKWKDESCIGRHGTV